MVFAVDESQRYSGAALPILLRESRKVNTSVILATQYLDAWGEQLLKSATSNFGTLICFSVSNADSKKLSASLAPFTSEQVQTLNRYEAIVRMQYNGQTIPAFDVKTVMVENMRNDVENNKLLDNIRTRSRQHFTRPKAEVEAEIAQRYQLYPSLEVPDSNLPTEEIFED
jgi:hypothetical protein